MKYDLWPHLVMDMVRISGGKPTGVTAVSSTADFLCD